MHHWRQFHHTPSKNGPNVNVVTHLSRQTFQSLVFDNLSGMESSRNDLDMVPVPQHWGIHSCMVLFDPLSYELPDILLSDNCVATVSLIIFFSLSVFKVSSEISNFGLFSSSFLCSSCICSSRLGVLVTKADMLSTWWSWLIWPCGIKADNSNS